MQLRAAFLLSLSTITYQSRPSRLHSGPRYVRAARMYISRYGAPRSYIKVSVILYQSFHPTGLSGKPAIRID